MRSVMATHCILRILLAAALLVGLVVRVAAGRDQHDCGKYRPYRPCSIPADKQKASEKYEGYVNCAIPALQEQLEVFLR
jgi:hypothetical protein